MRAIVLTAMVLLSGCATMVRGTSQQFSVSTEPTGATVSTTLTDEEGRALGCAPTPCAVSVPRRSEFIAGIELEGYQTVKVFVRSRGDREALALGTLGNQAVGTGVGSAWAAVQTTGALFPAVGTAGSVVAATGLLGTLIGGPILFVDSSTGALSTVYPNPIYLTLTPEAEAHQAILVIDPDELHVLTELGVQAAQRALKPETP